MPPIGKPSNKKNASNGDNKIYCRKCKKHKRPEDFGVTTNPMIDKNGKMSVCSDCCNELYDEYFSIHNNMEVALDLTCQSLDVCFNKEALKQTKSHIEKLLGQGKSAERVFGYYKSKLMSTGKANDGIDAFRYKDSDVNDLGVDDINIIHNINTSALCEYKVDNETIKYWGACKETWEYEFLEEELTRIQASFECPDYSMEMIMKDIALLNLDAEKIRRGILKSDLLKTIEARSKLMTDANMKPVQSTGAEASDQVTFGTLIKKWENEKPVKKRLDDEMKKYIDTFMVGQLARMEGLQGDITDKYMESLNEYTIDMDLDIEQDDE